jgi:porin-like protein
MNARAAVAATGEWKMKKRLARTPRFASPRILALACLAAALAATAARADDRAPPMFSFSGYGTLGVVHSDESGADYLADAFKPSGPGATRAWSADVDSRIAGQVNANFTSRLSGVVQVISQQRYDNSYRPTIEWANLKYQVTPDFSVRAGRIVLPVYMVTDSRRIGYANPWVRPPVEVYSLVPVTSNDGVDMSYRLGFGEFTNTLQATVGRSDSKFPALPGIAGGTAKVRSLTAVVDTIDRGFGSLRLSYGRARLTIDAFDPLFDAVRLFGPQGDALIDKYAVDDKQVTFVGVGASYDPGKWFAMGEWAHFDTRSVIGAKSAWYLSGGYRFGKATPYVTYARNKGDSRASDPGLDLTGLPPQLVGIGTALNAALALQLAQVPVQETLSVGVRWDFVKNAALKLQYDRVKPSSSSPGTFGNFQPSYQPGHSVQLFSAAIDFVF